MAQVQKPTIATIGEIKEIEETSSAEVRGIVASWRGKTFQVGMGKIYAPDDMGYSRSSNLKEKKKSKQQYAAFKNLATAQFTCKVKLAAIAGVDVAAECESWTALQDGKGEKLYTGGRAVLGCPFLLEKVSVAKMHVSAIGMVDYAELDLSFKQSGISTTGGEEKTESKKKKKKKKKTNRSSASTSNPESQWERKTRETKENFDAIWAHEREKDKERRNIYK